MNDMEQLITKINSGNMTVEQLEKLLENVNNQLARYGKALEVIEKAGTDNWTYEIYAESLQIGSAGQSKPIARQQWEQMFKNTRLEFRKNALNYITEGQQNFEQIKAHIEAKLAP